MSTIIWFTGLSGSGKTTIAEALKKELEAKDLRACVLDGDVVRATLHKNLGFNKEDIQENNRLISELAKEKRKEHDVVLVPIISPFRKCRAMARKNIGNGFVELFVNRPIEECIRRDAKGLYEKALAGEIQNFIGVDENMPYEAPETPDLEIKTDNTSLDESVKKILSYLNNK